MTSFPMVLAVLLRSQLALKPRCDDLRNVSAQSSLRNPQPSGSLSSNCNRLSSSSRRKAAMPAALHMGDPKSEAGWEKCQRKPPTMAISLFLDRDHAKAGDNPGAGLGKILRESPIMAISEDSGERIGETRDDSRSTIVSSRTDSKLCRLDRPELLVRRSRVSTRSGSRRREGIASYE